MMKSKKYLWGILLKARIQTKKTGSKETGRFIKKDLQNYFTDRVSIFNSTRFSSLRLILTFSEFSLYEIILVET